jgi:hypothetical protein
MSPPFVIAATIARNRAWILPTWLRAVSSQTIPPDAIYILLNDCTDDSRRVILENAPDSVPLFVQEMNTGETGWDRIEPRYSTANIAKLRNEMVDRVLRRWPGATHIWSVDSDVEPAADCLELLLGEDRSIMAAVVRNGDKVWNFMCGLERKGENLEPTRYGDEGLRLEYLSETFSVYLLGACVLIRRGVLESDDPVRYGANPRGEDFPFCSLALEIGYSLFVHPLARTRHHMRQGEAPLESIPCIDSLTT